MRLFPVAFDEGDRSFGADAVGASEIISHQGGVGKSTEGRAAMHWITSTFLSSLAVPALLIGGALILGGPAAPEPRQDITGAFAEVDFTTAPLPETLTARDGAALTFRHYRGAPGDKRIVVALHGSGGSGISLHPLAMQLSKSGPAVITPDLRGHGASGRRGDVDYAGQLEDDLDDLIAALRQKAPDARISILGFSMGGGLALRYAAPRPEIERAVLIAPYLAHDAAPMQVTGTAAETPWATAGVPRIAALSTLNAMGITAFDHLTVVRLGVTKEDRRILTAAYSHRLLRSANPRHWRADMKRLGARMTLLAGSEDTLHNAKAYRDVLTETAPEAVFQVIEKADHMALTLAPHALGAISTLYGDTP